MPETWLLIEVEDSILQDKPLGDGVVLRYMVSPSSKVFLEERTGDEVLESAQKQGFEIFYANSTNPGVPPWIWKRIEVNVVAALRTKLGKNVRSFAVSINPLNRLTKY